MRWRQISVRTLLLLVTLIAVCLGLHVRRTAKQRSVVHEIRQLGGSVTYAPEYYGTNPVRIPSWLVSSLGQDFFYRVTCVDLNRTNVTDDSLAILSNLPHIKVLMLHETPITDLGVPHLILQRN